MVVDLGWIESASMTTKELITPGLNVGRGRTVLGSTGFYAVARLSVLAILLAVSSRLTTENLFPPSLSQPTMLLLVWGYAVFTLIATIGLLFNAYRTTVAQAALILDITFFIALVYTNRTGYDLVYPLFVVPLVGATILLPRRVGYVLGVFAAGGYGLAYIINIAQDLNRSIYSNPVALLALGLHCALLVFIPWLTGGLVERWSADNRRQVEAAEKTREVALAEADAYRMRMRALYEVAYTISTSGSYQTILDTTLIESHKLAPYNCALVLLATGQPDELFVAASQGLSEEDRTKRITLGQGSISQALRETEPFVIDDMHVEAVLTPIQALARCKSACVIPLRFGMRSYGVMMLGSERKDVYAHEQVEMILALANYALIALQNAQLVYDLQTERTKLLSKEEEVRFQLARDLHDGPAQALAAITMNAEFIKRLLERDPARVLPELDKLGSLARRTTYEVRTMLFELRPLALETQGLDKTLQQYLERFQKDGSNIILDTEPITANLDSKIEGALFNIIQECVNNAMKHARAQHIWVRLKQHADHIEAIVEDDGRGFDLAAVKASYSKRGSFGLLNIEERAELVGGMAEMQSSSGHGTKVRVIVPVPDR